MRVREVDLDTMDRFCFVFALRLKHELLEDVVVACDDAVQITRISESFEDDEDNEGIARVETTSDSKNVDIAGSTKLAEMSVGCGANPCDRCTV